MNRSIIFSVDDFGLTKGITDTILETVDNGPVRSVSLLANGEAFDYAIAEYKKRADHLSLFVHLDLTDGKALLSTEEVPHLVDEKGMFKYGTVERFWLAYLLSLPKTRVAFRREVRAEIQAQCNAIRQALGIATCSVNSHRHVHLVHFVFDELMQIDGITAVRTVREPFFFVGVPETVHLIAREVLRYLSWRARRALRQRNIHTNDWFVGFMYSGHMTEHIARAGLAHIPSDSSVEILFHPGSAQAGELKVWNTGNTDNSWHFSPSRTREREEIKSFNVAKLLTEHHA